MLERIGSCTIVEEVASGGMAVVYRAIQDDLNRTVAIKALRTAIANDEQLITRFEREATSLAQLQHENIIHIYDFYREGGALFIVMEYVDGIDLFDLLERCGRLPYDVAAILAMQVARALDYIHFHNIIHRDIKPANIMISNQGGVKVMDFGIARDRNYGKDLTETGTGIGTPSYMSPEQIFGDKLDARSDLFSLGIVLYQMVTGRKPFVEDEERSVMHKIRTERQERVRTLNPHVPRELERIIEKCLQKQPRNRWRSGQQLVMALERFLSKHVEMNYHARLVLYLKNQGLITAVQADQYLNPTGMNGETALNQPDVQVRRQMRQAFVVQSSILVVVALMIGLIHLAPLGATVINPLANTSARRGFVRLSVHPWGEVLVNDIAIGTTPMADPLELAEGRHRLTIRNDFFEDYHSWIDVAPTERETPKPIAIDLEKSGTARIEVEKLGNDK